MNGQTKSPHFEPRWSVALAILAVIFLLALLPDRIRLLPTWATYVVGFGVLIPIGAVGLTTEKARWLRVERTVTLLFFVVAGAVTLGNLANLIGAMVYRSREISGLELSHVKHCGVGHQCADVLDAVLADRSRRPRGPGE
jgi:hypothetical protein